MVPTRTCGISYLSLAHHLIFPSPFLLSFLSLPVALFSAFPPSFPLAGSRDFMIQCSMVAFGAGPDESSAKDQNNSGKDPVPPSPA